MNDNKKQIDNIEITKKSLSKSASNPISSVAKPSKSPSLTTTKKTKSSNKSLKTQVVTEPISLDSSKILAHINNFNTPKSTKKLQAEYLSVPVAKQVFDMPDFIKALVPALYKVKTAYELSSTLQRVFADKLNTNFVAFGTYHEKSKCINLKLSTTMSSTYTSKIFLSDENNPIVEVFNTQKPSVQNDIGFLNVPYLKNSQALILPLVSVGQAHGVMIIAKDEINKANIELLNFVSNYCGLFLHNISLLEMSNKYANTDTLTGLYNHRGFQEILSAELKKAENTETNLSIIMFDVNNISKINKEYGHAKGDEIIKLLAEKIKQNARSSDKAGRYGGDEIALIMPDTSTVDAKYLAEYITYCLSCCFVDDVGPVRVSVGIATYPECSRDQEKLLILAEQAMYISQSKGYKEGMSAIISSSDFNFWDNHALNSFAEIIAKRHSQLGINFEEELVNQFQSEQISSQNHLIEMVTSLAGAIDAKDPYTKGHSTSVSRYSEALARAINLPEDEVQRITLGALLHDVGKIGIPENVLKKPGKLDDEEWEIMKQHPVIGAEKVLAPNDALRDLIPMVKYHHEHFDGSGYPSKLKGEDIPLAARIVSVADTFHALISDRPYRKGMSVEKACTILKDGSGSFWDPDLIRHFISIAPSLSTTI
ncbi:MAG: diguanylate cyclase [Candidatus Gastranaerophilales bacterium]